MAREDRHRPHPGLRLPPTLLVHRLRRQDRPRRQDRLPREGRGGFHPHLWVKLARVNRCLPPGRPQVVLQVVVYWLLCRPLGHPPGGRVCRNMEMKQRLLENRGGR